MIPENWPAKWQETDLSEYRAGFLTGRDGTRWIFETLSGSDPAAIWSLSDGDVAWWCYDYLVDAPGVQPRWLGCLDRTSGMSAADRTRLIDDFEAAARHAPDWLIQYAWDPAERFTYHALTRKGVEFSGGRLVYQVEPRLKVDCNSIYRLHDHGLFWRLLAGRKLAIVSGQADAVARRIVDGEFVRANGGEVTWSMSATIDCPPVGEAKWPYWHRMRDELERADWDLLLCSAGALSALICDHARRIGRKALDIGAFDRVLLGGQHTVARVLREAGRPRASGRATAPAR